MRSLTLTRTPLTLSKGVGGYDHVAAALFRRMTGSPSAAVKTIYDNFARRLRAAGLSSLTSYAYLMATDTAVGHHDGHLNMMGPAGDLLEKTPQGWTDGVGIMMNGVSSNDYCYSLDQRSAFVASYSLPDTAYNYSGAAGQGFTCTGMDRAADGTWWVANFGQLTTSGSIVPTLIHVSADFATKLQEIDLTALYNFGGVGNGIQGLCIDDADGTLWVIANHSTASLDRVLHIDPAGPTLLGYIQPAYVTAGYNALCYDNASDQLVVGGQFTVGDTAWVNKHTGSVVKGLNTGSPDHIYILPGSPGNHDEIWAITGPNAVPAQVRRFDAVTKEWLSSWSVFEAQAPEGIVVDKNGDGTFEIYIANDAKYHLATVNSVIRARLSPHNEESTTAYTIAGIFRLASTPGSTRGLFGLFSGTNKSGISLHAPSGGTTMRVLVGSPSLSAAFGALTANFAVPSLTTRHRFVTEVDMTAGTVKHYVNGSLVATVSVTGCSPRMPGYMPLYFGVPEAANFRISDAQVSALLCVRAAGKAAEIDAALTEYQAAVGL